MNTRRRYCRFTLCKCLFAVGFAIQAEGWSLLESKRLDVKLPLRGMSGFATCFIRGTSQNPVEDTKACRDPSFGSSGLDCQVVPKTVAILLWDESSPDLVTAILRSLPDRLKAVAETVAMNDNTAETYMPVPFTHHPSSVSIVGGFVELGPQVDKPALHPGPGLAPPKILALRRL